MARDEASHAHVATKSDLILLLYIGECSKMANKKRPFRMERSFLVVWAG